MARYNSSGKNAVINRSMFYIDGWRRRSEGSERRGSLCVLSLFSVSVRNSIPADWKTVFDVSTVILFLFHVFQFFYSASHVTTQLCATVSRANLSVSAVSPRRAKLLVFSFFLFWRRRDDISRCTRISISCAHYNNNKSTTINRMEI